MEYPEPYNSLPRRLWSKLMRATPKSYATAAVKSQLRNQRRCLLRQSANPDTKEAKR